MIITKKDVGHRVRFRNGTEGIIYGFYSSEGVYPVCTLLDTSDPDKSTITHQVNGRYRWDGQEHNLDIVGWVNERQNETAKDKKMKYEPFDLGRALAGEPVVLRDGSKAFVRHLGEELTVDARHQLTGYRLTKRAGNKLTTWCLDGSYARQKEPDSRDIVGMYPQYRLIHGVKVPVFPDWRPKKGEEYYAVEILSTHFYRTLMWRGEWLDFLLQKRGLVYPATAAGNQAAILHAKAMLGIAEDNDAIN